MTSTDTQISPEEAKAISEAVALQARQRKAYNDLVAQADKLRDEIVRLRHEVELKDGALLKLQGERDLLQRQIASFHTHVSTFWTHINDLVSAIRLGSDKKLRPTTPLDMKQFEKELSDGQPSNPSPDRNDPIPGFLTRGPATDGG